MAKLRNFFSRVGTCVGACIAVLLLSGIIWGPIVGIVVTCKKHPEKAICHSHRVYYTPFIFSTVEIRDDNDASSFLKRDGVLSTAGDQPDFNATFHAENITMSMCQHPVVNHGNLPSPAFYRDCNALQNELRNKTGFWETSGWAADLGDQKEILLQGGSCVVTLDRPDEGTGFVLIGNEDVVAWIDLAMAYWSYPAQDGEMILSAEGQTNCAGATLGFKVAGTA